MNGNRDGGANSYQDSAFAGGPFDQRTVFHPNTPNAIKAQFFQGMSVTFLGTGSGQPNLWRACSSAAVRLGGRTIMVDCGEGSQIQMMKSKGLVTFQDIDTVLITHMHADHILGLPGLLFGLDTTWSQRRQIMKQNHINKLKQQAIRDGKNPKLVGEQRKGSPCGPYDVPHDIFPPKPVTIAGPPGLCNYIQSAACMSLNSLSAVDITVKELWGGKFEAGMGRNDNPRNPFLNQAEHFRHKNIKLEKVWKKIDGTWDIEEDGELCRDTLGKELKAAETEEEYDEIIKAIRPNHNGGDRPISIQAAEVWHVNRVQTFGYSIKEQDPLPRINPERARALGCQPGPHFDLLKLGFDIENSTGEVVTQDNTMLDGSIPKGRHLVILGDCKSVSKPMGS